METAESRKGRPAPKRRRPIYDEEFAFRLKDWRENTLGITQVQLMELLADLAGYVPRSATSLSRLELGQAHPTLELVNAIALVDRDAEGGLGRGRSYWGWGEIEDTTIRRHVPAPKAAQRVTLREGQRRGAR